MMAKRYLETVGEMENRLNILMRQQGVLSVLTEKPGEDVKKRQAQARAVGEAISDTWKSCTASAGWWAIWSAVGPGRRKQQLLSLRYLSGLSYPDIAEILGYSERQVFRIHQRAILHLEALMAG